MSLLGEIVGTARDQCGGQATKKPAESRLWSQKRLEESRLLTNFPGGEIDLTSRVQKSVAGTKVRILLSRAPPKNGGLRTTFEQARPKLSLVDGRQGLQFAVAGNCLKRQQRRAARSIHAGCRKSRAQSRGIPGSLTPNGGSLRGRFLAYAFCLPPLRGRLKICLFDGVPPLRDCARGADGRTGSKKSDLYTATHVPISFLNVCPRAA
jgi:RNase P protein component